MEKKAARGLEQWFPSWASGLLSGAPDISQRPEQQEGEKVSIRWPATHPLEDCPGFWSQAGVHVLKGTLSAPFHVDFFHVKAKKKKSISILDKSKLLEIIFLATFYSQATYQLLQRRKK